MKRFRRIVLPLVLALILFAMPASAAGSGTLSITADKTTLNEGDIVEITLELTENPGIITVAVDLQYDTNVFEAYQPDGEEELFSLTGMIPDVASIVKEKTGVVTFDLGNDIAKKNYTETGKLGKFWLRVKTGVSSGNYEIKLKDGKEIESYGLIGNTLDYERVPFDFAPITLTINGSKCEHQLTKTEAVPASCEKAGNKEYFTCSKCHKLFSDQTATQEITQESTVLAALGHAWDNGKVTTQPTCTEKGIRTYTCGNDSTHTKTEEIDALGHAWDNGKVTTQPTCTEKGIRTYTCGNDSTHTKTEEIDALGHAWDNGKVTTQPTCTEKGTKTYTCENDSTHTKTEEIDALDHDWDQGTIVKTASNSSRGQIEYACTRTNCGEKKTEEFDLIYRVEFEEIADADMKEKLEAAVPEGFVKENTSYIDVVMKVSVDYGASYMNVDDDTMPAGEFSIVLPYPEGTGAASHDFMAFQVLNDGSVKVLVTEKTASGLQAAISGTGALAISYKAISVPTPAHTPAPAATPVPEQQPEVVSNAPKTDGNGAMDPYFPLVGAAALIAIVGTCLVIRGKKRT